MQCCMHTIDQTPLRWPPNLVREQLIEDSYRLKLELQRCDVCAARYCHCYIEVFDDSWDFWCAVSVDEIAAISADPQQAIALIQSRQHVVLAPAWKSPSLYWEAGPAEALRVGPRGWF
jgi:hypothetical protein